MNIFGKLVMGCVFLAAAAAYGQTGKLSIQENDVVDGNKGVVTHLVISSGPGSQAVNLRYEGSVKNICYNKTRTICAINLRPGVEIGEVYIAVLMSSGMVKVIKDFNDQVGKNLKHDDRVLNTECIYVDGIKGRILELSCGTKGEPNYSLNVEVADEGEVTIVPGSVRKE